MPIQSVKRNNKKLKSLSKYFSNGIPNAYIKKVTLAKSSGFSICPGIPLEGGDETSDTECSTERELSFMICMTDRVFKKPSGKYKSTWFTNEKFKGNMYCRILQVTSEKISKIINGSKNPSKVTQDIYDVYMGYKKKSLYFKNVGIIKRGVLIEHFPIIFQSNKVEDYLVDSVKIFKTDVVQFGFTVRIKPPEFSNYLCYYAQCVSMIKNSPPAYGMPSTPDKIKIRSRAKQMDADPRFLDLATVEHANDKIIKLQDNQNMYDSHNKFRQKKIQNVMRKKVENNYNSDIFLTRNSDGVCVGRFFLDIGNILRDNSLLSSLLDIRNNQLIRFGGIKEIKIKRRRVSVFDGENSLGTYAPTFKRYDSEQEREEVVALFSMEGNRIINGAFQKGDNYYSKTVSVSSVDPIADNPLARLISFEDTYLSSKEDGTYQYGIELEMEDTISQKFSTILGDGSASTLGGFIDVVLVYYQTIKGKYDAMAERYITNSTTKKMEKTLQRALSNYSTLLYNIGKIDDATSFLAKAYKVCSAKTGTESGILATLEQMQNTKNELVNLKTKYLKMYNDDILSGDTLSLGGESRQKTILYKTYFKTTIEKNVNFVKLDFLGLSRPLGASSIALPGDIVERGNKETSMYFSTNPLSSDKIDNSTLNLKNGGDFLNLEKNKYVYFTAAEIESDKADIIKRLDQNLFVFDKSRYVLSTSIAKNKQTEEVYLSTKNVSDTNKKQSEVYTSFLEGLGATIQVLKKEKIIKDNTTSTNLTVRIEDEEYKAQSNANTTRTEKITSRDASIKRALSNIFLKNKSPTVLKSTYDFQSSDNGINKLINKKQLSSKKGSVSSVYSEIPNQIKSLFLQDYGITNKNWNAEDINISENTEYAEVFRNNYSLISKLVFLKSFRRNAEGRFMYNKPIYSPMNSSMIGEKNKTSLCKFEIYEKEELGVGNMLQIKYDIRNKYFMLGESLETIPVKPAKAPQTISQRFEESEFQMPGAGGHPNLTPKKSDLQAVGAGDMNIYTGPKSRGGY